MTLPPKSQFGQFAFFFITQMMSYFLIVANTRAFVGLHYLWTGVTDTLIASWGFVSVKLIADGKRGWVAGLGYTLGGTCGSLLSIWVTGKLYQSY